jgi:hypothetical protein
VFASSAFGHLDMTLDDLKKTDLFTVNEIEYPQNLAIPMIVARQLEVRLPAIPTEG